MRNNESLLHHGIVFWSREPLLNRAELNGLILLIMSIDAAVQRIAHEVAGDGDGEEETE